MQTADGQYADARDLFDAIPVSPTVPCSYFVDRESCFRQFRMDGDMPPELLDIALARGFRRCGSIYYRAECPACDACRSHRILVQDFQPRRSQRRVMRRNTDVRLEMVDPVPTRQKKRLYLRYQHEQHHRKDQERQDTRLPTRSYDPAYLLESMYYQMYTNPQLTRELQLWLEDRLVGFGNVDVGHEAASAVYFVFDPDLGKRSLGTLAILRGLEWARSRGLRYYYLGYHIAGHPKMDYKRWFGPAELLDMTTRRWELPCT